MIKIQNLYERPNGFHVNMQILSVCLGMSYNNAILNNLCRVNIYFSRPSAIFENDAMSIIYPYSKVLRSLHPSDPTLHAITPRMTLFPVHNLHFPVCSSFPVSRLIFCLVLHTLASSTSSVRFFLSTRQRHDPWFERAPGNSLFYRYYWRCTNFCTYLLTYFICISAIYQCCHYY